MLHKEHILTKQYGGITNKKEKSQWCVKELNGGKMLNISWSSMETRSLNLKPKDFKKHNHKTKT